MRSEPALRASIWLCAALAVAVGCADDDAGRFGPDGTELAEARIEPSGSLELSEHAATLAVNETLNLRVMHHLADDTTDDVTAKVRWTSDAPEIAWIQSGTLVGVSPGVTTLTASYKGASDRISVSVTTAGLRALELSASARELPAGTGSALRAVGVFGQGARRDLTAIVQWQSMDLSVAVMQGNTARARSKGSVSIEASIGGVTGLISLSVADASLVDLRIENPKSSLPFGSRQQLRAVGTFSDGQTAEVSELAVWTSNDPDVVRVDADGMATAIHQGLAQVSAEYLDHRATTSIKADAVLLRSIDVTPHDATLERVALQQVHATGQYTDESLLDLTQQVEWRSSDPGVLTVSRDGLAQTISSGEATVTATLGEVSGSTKLTID